MHWHLLAAKASESPGFVLGVGAGLVFFFLVVNDVLERQERATKRRWAAIATELGLTARGIRIRGVIDGIALRACTSMRGSGKARKTYTVITAKPPLDLSLTIVREGFFGRGRDARTGDRAFDAVVRFVSGDSSVVVALDPRGRAAVREAIDQGWQFADGVWALELIGVVDEVGEILEQALSLARFLHSAVARQPAELARRVSEDPIVPVRVIAMRTLLDHFGAAPETAEALPHARALVAELAAKGLAGTADERLALADALAFMPHPAAEPLLVALLADDDKDIAVLAATALGAVGTPTVAVPALASRRDELLAGAVGLAAAKAIASIHARAGSPDAGALALSDAAPDVGALAFPTAPE